jgi:hypothetical protein
MCNFKEKMKKFITLLTCLMCANFSYSQINNSKTSIDTIPCNIEIKVDSYSGKKTIETGFVSFNGGSYLLSKEKGIVNLWLQLESSILLTIEAGEIIYFKFSDNSIIKFVNNSTEISDYSEYSKNWTNSFSFNLTGTKLEQLKTKKIIGIKCYINEYNISESESLNFKNDLNCILKAK